MLVADGGGALGKAIQACEGNLSGILYRNMAKTKEERNAEIVLMSRNGISNAEIARTFRLSRANIGVIVRAADSKREQGVKNSRLLAVVRETDDLDKLWPTADLLDMLIPLTETKMALLRHLHETSEISLRDIMDLTISEMKDPRPGYLIVPLLDLRRVGRKGFWSIVSSLSELDLGQRSNTEWKRRLARLNHARRIKGASHLRSRSQPAPR